MSLFKVNLKQEDSQNIILLAGLSICAISRSESEFGSFYVYKMFSFVSFLSNDLIAVICFLTLAS